MTAARPTPRRGRLARALGGVPLVRAARRSLTLRMAFISFAVGTALVLLLVLLATNQLRASIFDNRVETLLQDATVRAATTQTELDATAVTSADDASVAAQTQVSRINDAFSGAGGVGVLMRRAANEDSTTVINDLTTSNNLTSLVTPELVSAVEQDGPGAQHWQSVALSGDNGEKVPGVVVGTQVALPKAGTHDLFLVYSLAAEQRTLALAVNAVTVVGLGFILILILAVWILSWRVLLPVRQTSLAAQRLARGQLQLRLNEAGQDEIGSLSRSFNTMAAAIEEQIARYDELSHLQRRFVSDVSHELRTPLTTIRLAGEQIYEAREDLDDPLLERSAVLLFEQIERFDTMLGDLLAISRIDAGATELHLKDVDMTDLVEGVIALTGPLATEKGMEVRLHAPEAPVLISLDTVRIERIVRNLIINAYEHGEGRPLDVTVAQTASCVAVRVRDHGVGMTEEVASHVFDRFFRADPSRKRTTGGTGLGLSISYEDAQLHGGALEAWGWPGDGSSFLLTLPRVPKEELRERPLPTVPEDAPVMAQIAASVEPPATPHAEEVAPPPVLPVIHSRATRYADETGANPPVVVTAEAVDDTDQEALAVAELLGGAEGAAVAPEALGEVITLAGHDAQEPAVQRAGLGTSVPYVPPAPQVPVVTRHSARRLRAVARVDVPDQAAQTAAPTGPQEQP